MSCFRLPHQERLLSICPYGYWSSVSCLTIAFRTPKMHFKILFLIPHEKTMLPQLNCGYQTYYFSNSRDALHKEEVVVIQCPSFKVPFI